MGTFMRLALAFVALLMAAAQDKQPTPAELVQKLGDEDFRAREEAEKKLIQMGAPAVAELKKVSESEDVEIRERAKRIIAEIERNAAVSKVYVAPAPVTVSGKIAVKDVLAKLQGDCQSLFDVAAIRGSLDTEVSLDLKNAAPFDVLDALCKQLDKTSYKIEGAQIKFVNEAYIDYPSVAVEAFNVKITKIEKYSSNTFQKQETAWAVTMGCEAFPNFKTFGTPSVNVVEVLDDQGNKAKQTEKMFVLGQDNDQNNPANQWAIQARWAGVMGQVPETKRVFTFVSEKDVAKVQSIKGVASFYFRIDSKEVKFENVGQHQEMDLEDFKVVLDRGQRMGNIVVMNRARGKRGQENSTNEVLALILEPKKDTEKWLASVAGDLLDKDSVVAVDKTGAETKVEVTYNGSNPGGQVIMVNGQWQQRFGGQYALDLGKLKIEDVKEIRLKIPGVHRKDVSFEIKDVKLP
jgi:hypothetical protein